MKTKEEKKIKKAKAGEFISKMKELPPEMIMCEVISFNVRPKGANGVFEYASIVKALKDNDLDEKFARELTPKGAFARAMKKLEDERVVDEIPSSWKDGTTIYQFTKKFLEKEQWEHEFETKMVLNNETGEITCKNKELAAKAKKEMERCMEERYTADVSLLLHRIFQSKAELMPFGGNYIVMKEHLDFVDQVERFHIDVTDQKMLRLTIPVTERNREEVALTCEASVYLLADQLEEAIKAWTINTRDDTVERKSAEIKEMMLKIDGLAWLYADTGKKLKERAMDCKKTLMEQIERITEKRAEAPPVEKGEARPKIFGYSVTAILRWMGSKTHKDEVWNYKDVRKVFKHFKIEVADSTIISQMSSMKTGSRGTAPELTPEQEEALYEIVKK